jgi:hypothetical protein
MMKYQLVIQFLEELYGDIDFIANVEDLLGEAITDAEVDGHDIGSGEVNIFIYTNNPKNTFKIAKNILEENNINLAKTKIAYREISGDHYFHLWPENLSSFKVT